MDELLQLSLNQGKQFNHYQTKIRKNDTKTPLNKNQSYRKEGFTTLESFVSLEQEQMVRPSSKGYVPVLKYMQQTTKLNNSVNQLDLDELNQLKAKFNALKQEYTNTQQKISKHSSNVVNRLDPNNPFLNKVVSFSTGQLAYVTNQGVLKYIASTDILNSINVSNDAKKNVKLNIPWDNSYLVPGTSIPTNPPLLSGNPVQKGQRLGKEGTNVYAYTLVNNPKSNYIGCYNNYPTSTNTNIVPVMNSSNNVNGFVSGASSIYASNNTSLGPWAAFDQNPNTYWASLDAYDSTSGAYTGSNSVTIVTTGNVLGEFLQIDMPGVNTSSAENIMVIQYSLVPSLNTITTGSPNSWYVLGYTNSQWNQLDRQQNQTFTNGTPLVYNIAVPGAYSSYILLVDVVGNSDQTANRNILQIAEWNLFSNSTNSSNSSAMISDPGNLGYTTFNNCQEYAVNNGYTYFGLQNLQVDGTSTCMVSNDISSTKMYGDATSQYTSVPIWATNTSGTAVINCYVSNVGSLILNDASGNIVWQSPNAPGNCLFGGGINQSSLTATYGGNCTGSGYTVTQGNSTTAVLQSLASANYPSQLSFSVNSSTLGDPAEGCAKNWDTSYQCGNTWINGHIDNAEGQNYLYDCSSQSNNCSFYLILQNDGNVCLYRGTDPSSNNGLIWATSTNGKQMSSNPNWVSANGTLGRNYLTMTDTLSAGDWIGSDNGAIMLAMQNDGNLVLYTSETTSGCSAINNITYGNGSVNAVYQLNAVGNPASLGKIGYVDSESNLREYPDSMVGFTNDYQIVQGTDLPGNDISSLTATDQTSCQTACTNNPDCAAYTYQSSSQTCWLKNASSGATQVNNSMVLGIRQPGINGASKTCSTKISNIDTIQYNNYLKGDAMSTDTLCNASMISQTDKTNLDNIKTQLTTLGNDIAIKMEKLYNRDNKIYEKLNTNAEQFKKDIEKYKTISVKLQNFQTNNIEGMENLTNTRTMSDLNGMLSDSDLRVLHENYSYIMWSILAVGLLTVSINLMRK